MSNSDSPLNIDDFPRAGFLRRLAAMVYDSLVATAVFMIAAIVFTLFALLGFTLGWYGQEFTELTELSTSSVTYKVFFTIWTVSWVIGFFMWFWVKGGQTIGMRAWRLRLYSTSEEPVTLLRLWVRLFTSLLGLGTLLCLFDRKQKLALQDRASQTEMLVLTKSANDHKNWR